MRLPFANPHPYLPEATSGRDISIHEQALRWRAAGIDVAVFCERAGLPALQHDDGPEAIRSIARRNPSPPTTRRVADWKPDVAIYPFVRSA